MKFLRSLLSHPLTRGFDIDQPLTTMIRKQVIDEKPFLRKIYALWYRKLVDSLPHLDGKVLELGSGAGFLEKHLPQVITSEVFFCNHIKVVLDGLWLPFADGSLSAVIMSDVFHHLHQPHRFLQQAERCIQPGGVISMIEPWHTPWSARVYTHLHQEPFEPDVLDWDFPSSGPLSSANQALPWIVFERDLQRFQEAFPNWKLEKVEPFMPFSYLASGGISLRNLMPGWSFRIWHAIDQTRLFNPARWGMFAHIVLKRLDSNQAGFNQSLEK